MQKDDIFELLYRASKTGLLGLFIGAGFSKALMQSSDGQKALNWKDLLSMCCDKMEVAPPSSDHIRSYPEWASSIAQEHAEANNIDLTESVQVLKQEISTAVNYSPSPKRREQYRNYLETLDMQWIITTNYDSIIENLLTGRALSIGPEESFMQIKGLVPVYHIHGRRTHPDEIVITNEDYVSQFRPSDYRQARLPFLLKESTVLMIGYGLGDINVISAVDWRKNVYTTSNNPEIETKLIQLVYKENPEELAFRDKNDVIIYEIDDLSGFFDELTVYFQERKEWDKIIEEDVKELDVMFQQCSDDDVNRYINNLKYRKNIINDINNLEIEFEYIYSSYVDFLDAVNDECDNRSQARGAFGEYALKLEILLNNLISYKVSSVRSEYFYFLADSLNNLSYWIGWEKGKSFSARRTWNTKKSKIPDDVLKELKSYCESRSYSAYRLSKLLEEI